MLIKKNVMVLDIAAQLNEDIKEEKKIITKFHLTYIQKFQILIPLNPIVKTEKP